LGETIAGSDERVRRLATNLSSHSGRFIITGGEPLNSDDAFRAAQYLEAQKRHKKDIAANKAEKDMYKYQEAAKGVLTMEKEAKDLSKKDWDALIRFGVKLKDLDAPFTAILKKDIPFLCHYYIEHLQDLVEDEENHIAKPPDSISEPNVPSLEETMLEQERQRK
jgi:organic radical activating enzyme